VLGDASRRTSCAGIVAQASSTRYRFLRIADRGSRIADLRL